MKVAIFVMGISGLVAQILLLRELLIVFSGNELSIGIVLANWLVLEALGSFLAGRGAEKAKNKIEAFVAITIVFALSLFAAIYFTRVLKIFLGVSIGEGVGILTIFYSSFLILLPTSVTHGALFTFGCRIFSLFGEEAGGPIPPRIGIEDAEAGNAPGADPEVSCRGASSVGRVYVFETIGTLVGGIVWTYLLIPYLHSFEMAAWIAVLNFLVGAALLLPRWRRGGYQKGLATICCLLLVAGISFISAGGAGWIHRRSIDAQWRAQNVVHYQNSVYGNISVIESAGQYTFFFDGIPHIATPIPDIVFVEEFAHLPLLSHPDPESVLILSGGAGGIIYEILKHPSVKTVDYAELDPLVLELLRKFPTPLTEDELDDERVGVRHLDGRLFLKTAGDVYDLIFVGLPEPADLQTNRFFTEEFFALAGKRLAPEGILVIALPGSLTYLSDELRDLNSCVFNTLKSAFPHVRVFPGDGANIFLASDSGEISRLDQDLLVRRVGERNLQADLIVPRHIEYKLHPRWVEWFLEFMEGGSREINRDFRPMGMFYSVARWNAIFNPRIGRLFRGLERLNLWMFVALFAVFAGLTLLRRARPGRSRPGGITLCVGTTGFAGMIFDLALIFTFQAIYGYVFHWLGLLVSFFMAGAAAGAMKMTSLLPRIKNDRKFFIGTETVIIGFSLLLPFIFLALQPHLDRPAVLAWVRVLFLFLSLASGLVIGAQFPLANKIRLREGGSLSGTAGLLYGTDLLGGWLGGIAGGVVLLPVLGLLGSCLVVALFKLSSFVFITSQSRKSA